MRIEKYLLIKELKGGGVFKFDKHNTKIFIFVEFCVNTHESAATMPGKFKN